MVSLPDGKSHNPKHEPIVFSKKSSNRKLYFNGMIVIIRYILIQRQNKFFTSDIYQNITSFIIQEIKNKKNITIGIICAILAGYIAYRLQK